jgi:hypothetical protein
MKLDCYISHTSIRPQVRQPPNHQKRKINRSHYAAENRIVEPDEKLQLANYVE